jgi:Ni/Co efflux regulator RcnB
MKMTTATRVAALAVGLSLAGATAFAAPGDGRRGQDNDNPTASDQQKPDQKNDRRRGTRPDGNTAPAAQPAPAAAPAATPPRGTRQTRDNRRGQNDLQVDRNRAPAARNDDRRRDYGNRNDRRNTGDRNDRRRDVSDRNERRDARGNNDRRRADVRQYRRNYDSPRRYRAGSYQWRDGYSYNRYRYGQRLPRHFYGRNFWLTNFVIFGLFPPPDGYVWVRYGPDAILIDEYTGEIVQVRYNVFYS